MNEDPHTVKNQSQQFESIDWMMWTTLKCIRSTSQHKAKANKNTMLVHVIYTLYGRHMVFIW